MSLGAPTRTHRRPISTGFVAGLFVVAAIVGALGFRSLTPSPSGASPIAVRSDAHGGALGEADGAVPDGTTIFDDEVPAVANLDPELLAALRRAATRAGHRGIEFFVESGWRSPRYQQRLLDHAIAKYGSRAEAARWVATPDTSSHVTGDAVDIANADAIAWLAERGTQDELCRTYGNEPWHYELRPGAVDRGCPAPYADAAHDPRLRR
jgi:hypothetical protein